MKKLLYFVLFIGAALALLLPASKLTAQEGNVWIQIEAQPSLRSAQDRARAYGGSFDDVNGYSVGSGWYVIALGPFAPEDAVARLRQMRRENLIPRDSFVADGSGFRQQFWPIGTNNLNAEPVAATQPAENTTVAATPDITEPVEPPEETVAQARRSENNLSRDEKKLLQIAMQAEGFYNAAIDGSYGRGTRRAMAAYQDSRGYEPTGVLTTRQRTELIEEYNSILDGVGLAQIRNEDAGIEMLIPAGLVSFSRFEPPFVHYDSTTPDDVRVLLISQNGTRATMNGLYEIMQTLEIVPLEGERERNSDNFTLTGQNSSIHSYTYAKHENGMIKGFTVIWPAGDERRLARVIQEMQSSFSTFGEALSDSHADPQAEQSIDLLSGLEIRRPDISRTGFYIDARGSVITTAEVVGSCREITLNRDHTAEVAFVDQDLGIAVLRPSENLAPISFAAFSDGVARLQSEVIVAGYPYEGVLNAPTLTYGTLADVRGLRGEEDLQRLALASQAGNAGGPVFDANGSVTGLVLSDASNGSQQLPQDVSFALKPNALREALSANGVSSTVATPRDSLTPLQLANQAADMTVLVSCWN
ncbi:serine protease [Cochlodiniinecator piscidefendens]|uniref:serine protease n=1 Tax=Cochlodiniinecator piscidefendens TaxID=2715756 RepID=UPI00140C6B39|nr:serine protease [Cochlodiniinecator piscidefendens]